jgi:hypothetical protein
MRTVRGGRMSRCMTGSRASCRCPAGVSTA